MKLTLGWSQKLYHFLSVNATLSSKKCNHDEINVDIEIFLWNYLKDFIKHLMNTYIFNRIFMILTKYFDILRFELVFIVKALIP